MKQGQRETRRQYTAFLFLKPTGDSAFISPGHALECNEKFTENRTDVAEPQPGFMLNVGSLVNTIGWLYELKLSERFAETLKIIHLGTQASDETQAAIVAPAGTGSFDAVQQGRTYFIGKYDVSTVVVKVGLTTMEEGVDYKLDEGLGAITILPGGGIDDDDDVDITFGCAAVTQEVFQPLTELRKTGDVRIYLKDQYSKAPAETHTFNGEYWITDRGNNNGKDLNTCSLMILASEKPVIKTRK